MDDILMVYQKNGWDSRAFVQNFEKSDCYLPPLKLEAATGIDCRKHWGTQALAAEASKGMETRAREAAALVAASP